MTPTETVQAFYASLAAGDVPTVMGLFADKIEWTEAERFPYYSGTWTTPQQVLENLLIPLSRDWVEFGVRADRYIASGDTVVALGHYHGKHKATGKSMRVPLAHVWSVANQKVVGFLQYTDTALFLEATR